MPYLLDKAYLLPLIMAGSFLVILLFGKKLLRVAGEKAVAAVGVLAVAVCFVLALVIAGQWIQRVDHPPVEGSPEFAAAKAACLGASEPEGAHEKGGVGERNGAEHGDSTVEDAPSVGGSEHAMGIAEGESAAALAEPSSGESTGGAHSEVLPVCKTITWFETGVANGPTILPGIKFEVGTLVDGLSVMMLVTVGLISLLVHVYSIEYLRGDRRFVHYYAFLSLFTASMLFYVLGTNTLQMLVGWELVGLCSFGLIGHWWEEKKNTDAALKAFLTNRVGDTGLIIGVVVTFFAAGATSFNVLHINEYALSANANKTLLLVGALCLFAGVTSKSGQFPLHTWLPDAMAGPTPVSALIHAATMVVAGVYLIARLYAVFYGGLEIGSSSLHYVAFIGGLTTIIGGALAFVQYDLKKVLAYSTISQLGYMVMALGVGAWTAGVFHLFTHAMFKACLFLGAGSVSHACHHTFDMREMGGLKKYMPVTHATFLVSTLALAGIFPFAGFWSKDEILAGSLHGPSGGENAYYLMLVMGLITAFLTAAYMGRAYYLTFLGEYRGHGHPHESPKVMTVPLVILGFMGAVIGFVNFPGHIGPITIPENLAHRFEHYVQPTFAFPSIEVAPFTLWLAGLSLVLAVGGLVIGIGYYLKGRPLAGLTERNPLARAGYQFLVNKYYLDWLYEDVIADSTKGAIARAMYWVNQNIIDAIVNLFGAGALAIGRGLYRYVDQGVVDGLVNGSGMVSEESGQFLRRIQTGKVQQYAALLFGSAVALVFVLFIVS
ncbi:MAG: NADH-quinone oxidoreductase subunit L [Acidimicrobiales bacterium]|nr:NADH-quinone oxidoreductase subunit L [Acidimicrobiales bacterium]